MFEDIGSGEWNVWLAVFRFRWRRQYKSPSRSLVRISPFKTSTNIAYMSGLSADISSAELQLQGLHIMKHYEA